jgi:hypothetical protein
MNHIIEKKEVSIDNKIFTKDEVLSLLTLFVKQAAAAHDESKEVKRQELIGDGWPESNITEKHLSTCHAGFDLTSSDNIKYSFKFEDIKAAGELLHTMEIIEVEMYFSENMLNSKLLVKLRHSNKKSGSSYFLAESENSEWVKMTCRSLENVLNSCSDQTLFFIKYKTVIIAITTVVLVFFLFNLIDFFIRTKVMFPKIAGSMFRESFVYVILILGLISATPSILIYRWINNMFPGVEIQTGANIQDTNNRRRTKLFLMASLVIVPAILSYLLRLI